MRPVILATCALAMMAVDVIPASAAWNNVFQPTLFFRRRSSTTSAYVAPAVVYASPVVAAPPVVAYASPVIAAAPTACAACPQQQPCQQCTTQYVQRCQYQPVTTMTTQSYYEQVTTNQTSYYYEPVTSYRTSFYYDPCSCSYSQVATPTTTYEMRAKSSPVTSWVQRCAQVPVTSYQKSCYLQPQTTCTQTTTQFGAPIAMAPTPCQQQQSYASPIAAPTPCQQQQQQAFSAPALPPQGGPISINTPSVNINTPQVNVQQFQQQQQQPTAPPSVDTYRTPPPAPNLPQIREQYSNPGQQPMNPPMSWQPIHNNAPAAPVQPAPVSNPGNPPPPVKIDRIAVEGNGIAGQVVRSDNTPRAGAAVLFVNASQPQVRQQVQANTAGRFSTQLGSGTWHVYLTGLNGDYVYGGKLDVRQN